MNISVRELHLKDQETHHWDWKEAGTNWISLEWKLISILSLWMRMSKDMSGKVKNWMIYMRMMSCQSWRERNCNKV